MILFVILQEVKNEPINFNFSKSARTILAGTFGTYSNLTHFNFYCDFDFDSLALLLRRFPKIAEPILQVTGIFQTIPSLALWDY